MPEARVGDVVVGASVVGGGAVVAGGAVVVVVMDVATIVDAEEAPVWLVVVGVAAHPALTSTRQTAAPRPSLGGLIESGGSSSSSSASTPNGGARAGGGAGPQAFPSAALPRCRPKPERCARRTRVA